MTAYLQDFSGNEMQLPVLKSWTVCLGGGLPCDAFEACWVYDGELSYFLKRAVRFRAEHNGSVVFTGVVDQYAVRLDEGGQTVTVSGRGLAALLLDNQSAAVEYGFVSLSDILVNHVAPYGIGSVDYGDLGSMSGYRVSFGDSQWQALYGFTHYMAGLTPRFSPQGVMIIRPPEYAARQVEIAGPVLELSYTDKRYGVVSEMLILDKASGVSSPARNEDFIKQGGMCRKVATISLRNTYKTMEYSGRYKLEQTAAERVRLKITLPVAFAAFVTDLVELSVPGTGVSGKYRVLEAESSLDEGGERCRLTLSEI